MHNFRPDYRGVAEALQRLLPTKTSNPLNLLLVGVTGGPGLNLWNNTYLYGFISEKLLGARDF